MQVLTYMMEHGSITPLEALRECRCYRLSGRIKNLRDDGYDIVTDRVEYINEEGEPRHYARYVLKGECRA